MMAEVSTENALRFTAHLLDGQPRLAVVDGAALVDLADARSSGPGERLTCSM